MDKKGFSRHAVLIYVLSLSAVLIPGPAELSAAPDQARLQPYVPQKQERLSHDLRAGHLRRFSKKTDKVSAPLPIKQKTYSASNLIEHWEYSDAFYLSILLAYEEIAERQAEYILLAPGDTNTALLHWARTIDKEAAHNIRTIRQMLPLYGGFYQEAYRSASRALQDQINEDATPSVRFLLFTMPYSKYVMDASARAMTESPHSKICSLAYGLLTRQAKAVIELRDWLSHAHGRQEL